MAKVGRLKLIEFDGRTLEGGGQLLRNALCLSSLTGKPIRVTNIRGNRSDGGGLKAQHLCCVKWLAHACDAEVAGAELKSKTLDFRPTILPNAFSPAYVERKLPGNRLMFECSVEIGSAGSTALALQAILPYILFAQPRLPEQHTDCFVRLRLSGGTNVPASPSYEYITQVLLPTLEQIGLPCITSTLERRGWSTGRTSIGSFTLDIPVRPPAKLLTFCLAPDTTLVAPATPRNLHATFLGPSSCHGHLRLVLLSVIQRYFGSAYLEPSEKLTINCEDSGHDKRLYLIVVATVPGMAGGVATEYRLGRDWLYDRKIRLVERSVTEMAERVTLDLHNEWKSGGWVDEHMRDQLVIFDALSSGRSRIWAGCDENTKSRKPSLHTETANWVVERMRKRDIEGELTLGIDALSVQDDVHGSGGL